jgi:hypothetical protein
VQALLLFFSHELVLSFPKISPAAIHQKWFSAGSLISPSCLKSRGGKSQDRGRERHALRSSGRESSLLLGMAQLAKGDRAALRASGRHAALHL